MRMFLVAKGESASVRILKEGEVTDDPILHELTLDGFGPLSSLIENQPNPEQWFKILELMLCDMLKHGLITGAALMCGTFNSQADLMREKVSRDAIEAAASNAGRNQSGVTN